MTLKIYLLGQSILQAGELPIELPSRPIQSSLAEAFTIVEKTAERNLEAGLLRLRTEAVLIQGNDDAAEISLNKTILEAHRGSARLWKMRAAIDLANLCVKQGRIDEAKMKLGEIYGWFTERFEMPDLLKGQDAAGRTEIRDFRCGFLTIETT